MAEYKSKYTGEQIDEAVGKTLAGGGGGGYDLTINGNYGAITLGHILYSDGRTEVNRTFSSNTVLHNVTAFEVALEYTALGVSRGLAIFHPGTNAESSFVYPQTYSLSLYRTTEYNDAIVILLAPCTIAYTNN